MEYLYDCGLVDLIDVGHDDNIVPVRRQLVANKASSNLKNEPVLTNH